MRLPPHHFCRPRFSLVLGVIHMSNSTVMMYISAFWAPQTSRPWLEWTKTPINQQYAKQAPLNAKNQNLSFSLRRNDQSRKELSAEQIASTPGKRVMVPEAVRGHFTRCAARPNLVFNRPWLPPGHLSTPVVHGRASICFPSSNVHFLPSILSLNHGRDSPRLCSAAHTPKARLSP